MSDFFLFRFLIIHQHTHTFVATKALKFLFPQFFLKENYCHNAFV